MDFQEINERLQKICNDRVTSLAYDNFEAEEGLEYETVHSQGGEDKGSDWRRVLHFKQHDVYIEISGYYTSGNGVDFYDSWEDHVKEVRPKEITITVFE